MLKNGLYNVSGAVIRVILSVLTIPILVHIIGIEEYGLWTLVSSLVGIISLAEAGLSISTTVFISRDLAADDLDGISQTITITTLAILMLATSAAMGLWIGTPFIVSVFPKLTSEQQFTAIYAFRLGGLVVWLRLLQQILLGIEQAYQRYDAINILNTLHAILTSIGLALVVWLGGRTVAMMQWLIFSNVIILVLHVKFCSLLLQYLNLRLQWNFRRAKDIIRFSMMTWLGSIGGVMFSQCDRFVVGTLLEPQALGIYGAVTSIMTQINLLSSLPVQPLLPILSNRTEVEKFEHQSIEPQIKTALQVNALVALGIGGALFTLAPMLVISIIGVKLTNELLIGFRLAAIIYTFYSVNAVGYYILFGVNELKTFVIVQLSSGILALFLITIGAFLFGFRGAIIGNLGYLGVWFFTILGMRKLQISSRTWMQWLQFPLLWFLGVLIFGSMIGQDQPQLAIGLTALQSFIFLIWFCNSQSQNLQPIFQRIIRRL